MGITDQNLDTNGGIEILRGMGVYQERSLSQIDLPSENALRIKRSYVKHRLASGSQVELTAQQLASMLSENHSHRTRERLDQKKHLEEIRSKFHELLHHPGCQVHATELKEMWINKEKSSAREGPLSAPKYFDERLAIHKSLIGRQVRDENEMMVPTEDPEEARGHLGESTGEVFFWNQPEYLSDDSYGTRESRAGSGECDAFL
ncbi:hypothetical protein K450DRAFT_244383 [Umbelopsis ramanniana AG]|uniref:Uncharacterized protein n=1 Tax=Umbelopsis ramanniana AG TaxID=1314678 RepID=A0AAD5HEG6_UMBRA|nr:uncharacterized protein K450DRAFT_244383 [Umbelopsis ramanniana AG]KAI8578973.1 hypothetical protein K450DRAFT_244383 [Umbelopsis ramanniana AG]